MVRLISKLDILRLGIAIIIVCVFLSLVIVKVQAGNTRQDLDFVSLNGESEISKERLKYLSAELETTLGVLDARPDYRGAWERLSEIYLELGEWDLARQAKEKADSLEII